MRRLQKLLAALGFGLLSLATLPSPARAVDGMHLLLELHRSTDGEVTETISLWGTDIDPNTRSVDDRYILEINGEKVDAPQTLLADLDHARRGYSYDAFTNGITRDNRQALCQMAGPALGQQLVTRYLTYDNSILTGSEMRPVLSEALNCLFTPLVHPNAASAHLAATKALGSLSALLDLHAQ